MNSHIVAEYDNFSVWESPPSEPTIFISGGQRYWVSRGWIVAVRTYEDELYFPVGDEERAIFV